MMTSVEDFKRHILALLHNGLSVEKWYTDGGDCTFTLGRSDYDYDSRFDGLSEAEYLMTDYRRVGVAIEQLEAEGLIEYDDFDYPDSYQHILRYRLVTKQDGE